MFCFFSCASAESWQRESLRILNRSSFLRPRTSPPRTDPPEIGSPAGATDGIRPSPSVPDGSAKALAASLQEHVEGVHHALAQVGGAARCQQGAELEGFGDAVLVDVGQHVLVSLTAEDDLGVVVVEVDL